MLFRSRKREFRAIGLGLAQRLGRTQVGIDLSWLEKSTPAYAVGVSHVPANHLRLQTGYSSSNRSLLLGAQYRAASVCLSRSQASGYVVLTGVNLWL